MRRFLFEFMAEGSAHFHVYFARAIAAVGSIEKLGHCSVIDCCSDFINSS